MYFISPKSHMHMSLKLVVCLKSFSREVCSMLCGFPKCILVITAAELC